METISLDWLQAAALFVAIIILFGVLIGLIFLFAGRANHFREKLHEKILEDLEKDIKNQNTDLLKEVRELLGKEK